MVNSCTKLLSIVAEAVVPSTVTYGGKEYKVTGIGDRCFSNYENILFELYKNKFPDFIEK